MDFDKLKSIAPRERGEVELPDGEMLEVFSLDLSGRLGTAQFLDDCDNDQGMYFAYSAVHGCPAFKGKTPAEVVAQIDPLLIAQIGSKILELSGLTAAASEEAEKNSESDPS